MAFHNVTPQTVLSISMYESQRALRETGKKLRELQIPASKVYHEGGLYKTWFGLPTARGESPPDSYQGGLVLSTAANSPKLCVTILTPAIHEALKKQPHDAISHLCRATVRQHASLVLALLRSAAAEQKRQKEGAQGMLTSNRSLPRTDTANPYLHQVGAGRPGTTLLIGDIDTTRTSQMGEDDVRLLKNKNQVLIESHKETHKELERQSEEVVKLRRENSQLKELQSARGSRQQPTQQPTQGGEQYIRRIENMANEMRRLESTNRSLQAQLEKYGHHDDGGLLNSPRDGPIGTPRDGRRRPGDTWNRGSPLNSPRESPYVLGGVQEDAKEASGLRAELERLRSEHAEQRLAKEQAMQDLQQAKEELEFVEREARQGREQAAADMHKCQQEVDAWEQRAKDVDKSYTNALERMHQVEADGRAQREHAQALDAALKDAAERDLQKQQDMRTRERRQSESEDRQQQLQQENSTLKALLGTVQEAADRHKQEAKARDDALHAQGQDVDQLHGRLRELEQAREEQAQLLADQTRTRLEREQQLSQLEQRDKQLEQQLEQHRTQGQQAEVRGGALRDELAAQQHALEELEKTSTKHSDQAKRLVAVEQELQADLEAAQQQAARERQKLRTSEDQALELGAALAAEEAARLEEHRGLQSARAEAQVSRSAGDRLLEQQKQLELQLADLGEQKMQLQREADQMAGDLSAARGERADLAADLERQVARAQLDQQQAVDRLTQAQQDAEKQQQDLQQALKAARLGLAGTTKDLEATALELEAKKAKLAEHEARGSDQQALCEDLRAQVCALDASVQQQEQFAADLQQQHQAVKRACDEELGERRAAEQALAAAELKVQAGLGQVAQLEQQCTAKAREAADLAREVAAAKLEQQEAKQKLEQAAEERLGLEADLQKAEDGCRQRLLSCRQSEQHLASLQKSEHEAVKACEREQQRVQTELLEAHKALDMVQRELAAVTADASSAATRTRELELEVTTLTADAATAQASKRTLEVQMRELEQEHGEAQQQLQHERAQLDTLGQDLDQQRSLASGSEELRQQVAEREDVLNRLLAKEAVLESDLFAEREELQKRQDQFAADLRDQREQLRATFKEELSQFNEESSQLRSLKEEETASIAQRQLERFETDRVKSALQREENKSALLASQMAEVEKTLHAQIGNLVRERFEPSDAQQRMQDLEQSTALRQELERAKQACAEYEAQAAHAEAHAASPGTFADPQEIALLENRARTWQEKFNEVSRERARLEKELERERQRRNSDDLVETGLTNQSARLLDVSGRLALVRDSATPVPVDVRPVEVHDEDREVRPRAMPVTDRSLSPRRRSPGEDRLSVSQPHVDQQRTVYTPATQREPRRGVSGGVASPPSGRLPSPSPGPRPTGRRAASPPPHMDLRTREEMSRTQPIPRLDHMQQAQLRRASPPARASPQQPTLAAPGYGLRVPQSPTPAQHSPLPQAQTISPHFPPRYPHGHTYR